MICKYYHEEFCVNDRCPMCADYCPVPNNQGVCKYEELVDGEAYTLTPKGCLRAALVGRADLDEPVFNCVWADFSKLMYECGYVGEQAKKVLRE